MPPSKPALIDKLLWPLIPACLTFGPLFMTAIDGTADPARRSSLETAGLWMLVIGLTGVFRVIARQQKRILALEERIAKE